LQRSVCGCIFKDNAATKIGEVAIQLRIYGQIISVCNSKRIIKIGQYLPKSCSDEIGSSFPD